MRFMMIYKPANFKDMEAGVPPTPEHIAGMMQLIGELSKRDFSSPPMGCRAVLKARV